MCSIKNKQSVIVTKVAGNLIKILLYGSPPPPPLKKIGFLDLKNTFSEENLWEILLVKSYLKVYGSGLPSEIFRTLILAVFTLRKSKYILISIRRSENHKAPKIFLN